MKVKIIYANTVLDLEEKINEFLEDISNSQIVDIKYQGAANHPDYGGIKCPSAMVIIKDSF